VRERREHVGDLAGQLARRDDDDGARAAGRPPRRPVVAGGEPGQHRDAERERLAGAGDGARQDVTPVDRVREHPGLDRERLLEAPAGEHGDQLLREAELPEGPGLGLRSGGGLGQGALEDVVAAGARRPGAARLAGLLVVPGVPGGGGAGACGA
jgi:hypothetical protein